MQYRSSSKWSRRALAPTPLLALLCAAQGLAQTVEPATEPAAPTPAPVAETPSVQAEVAAPVVTPAPEPRAVVVTAAVPVQAAPTPVEEPAPAETKSVEPVEPEEAESHWWDAVTLSGYIEAYYAHNFNNPQNNITANRWLDEKSDSFTLQTVALDLDAKKGPFQAKVTLMFGPTADRWYFEKPLVQGGEQDVALGFGGYSNETWKHIQTAYMGYTLPVGNGLTLQGGLFPTQVGYEGTPAKDNFNFSRSNLFNFLPFFHVGARAVYPVTDKILLTAAMYNGWNQITDSNDKKTMSFQASFTPEDWLINLLYIGGSERAKSQETGQAWRSLFDGVVQYTGIPRLTLALSGDGGWEENKLGTNHWYGGAIHAQVKATDYLYFAARGDGIKEGGSAADDALILFGPGHIASATLTAELRPFGDGVSVRLEYRHDESDKDNPLYFRRGYTADGAQRLSADQDTLTLGLIGWF